MKLTPLHIIALVFAVGGIVGWLLGADLAGLGLVVGLVMGMIAPSIRTPAAPAKKKPKAGAGTVAGTLLALALPLLACSAAPLSPEQAALGTTIVDVGCDLVDRGCDLAGDATARLSPEDEAAARSWCARLTMWCGIGEVVTVAVLDALAGPVSTAPRLTSTAAPAPAVPFAEIRAACLSGLAPLEACAALEDGTLEGLRVGP